MKVYIDIETRSLCDLQKRGIYVYSKHESTDIYCIGLYFRESSIKEFGYKLWVNPKFIDYTDSWKYHKRPLGYDGYPIGGYKKGIDSDAAPEILQSYLISAYEVIEIAKKADNLYAFNASFERNIWNNVFLRDNSKYYIEGCFPISKWVCVAAKAAYYNLPRALKESADIAGSVKKDTEGHKIMLKWCKPLKQTKEGDYVWKKNSLEFEKLCSYCLQDTRAEMFLDMGLRDIPPRERAVWLIDQIINDNGIGVDKEAIELLIDKIDKKVKWFLERIGIITNGDLKSTKQIQKTLEWLKDNERISSSVLPNLGKEAVKEVLERKDVSEKARELLEIKQSLNKSSIAKLKKMLTCSCEDNRVRGAFLYYGAVTGRWAGRGIQPQNYPRSSLKSKEVSEILNSNVSDIEKKYGCIIEISSKCLRGMIVPSKDNIFFCADFSNIEGRVLAWIAEEKEVLSNYTDNKDPYILFASKLFKETTYGMIKEGVNKGDKKFIDMRFLGKIGELASQYQGWIGALKRVISKIEDEKAAKIISKWREIRKKTVSFWKDLEITAFKAMKNPEKIYCVNSVSYSYGGSKEGKFLKCFLPSGRTIMYYDPKIIRAKAPYRDEEKSTLSYMGTNPVTHKWERIKTYGGKLCQQITQALARDVLVEALFNLYKNDYTIVLHSHDEILVEVEKHKKSDFNNFIGLMEKVPIWAKDLPIKAGGWIDERYRK